LQIQVDKSHKKTYSFATRSPLVEVRNGT